MTIAAVIEAHGAGEIELEPAPTMGTQAAVHVFPGGKTYTLATVARFLGWEAR